MFFDKNKRRKIGKYTAKLTVLWYDKKPTSLQRMAMAAIPNITAPPNEWRNIPKRLQQIKNLKISISPIIFESSLNF